MKKLISVILAIVCALSLTACMAPKSIAGTAWVSTKKQMEDGSMEEIKENELGYKGIILIFDEDTVQIYGADVATEHYEYLRGLFNCGYEDGLKGTVNNGELKFYGFSGRYWSCKQISIEEAHRLIGQAGFRE